jgi:hypothetical protein
MTVGTKVRFDIAPGVEAWGFIDFIFGAEETIFYVIAYLAGGQELTYVVRKEGQFHAF